MKYVYKLVQVHDNQAEFEETVSKLMNDGWVPFGNLSVTILGRFANSGLGVVYIQPMIKLSDEGQVIAELHSPEEAFVKAFDGVYNMFSETFGGKPSKKN